MKKTAEEEYKTAKAQAIRMYGEAKADAEVYLKKMKVITADAYLKVIEMAEQMKKTAEEEYKTAKAQAIRMYGEAKADAEVYLKKMKVIAADAYLKVVEMV